ncbi:MAG: 50S ribosomal protein L29 [Thermoflexales bacterium]|nr:50S ribosomal protein L29 [Thermoflexales bacterium]
MEAKEISGLQSKEIEAKIEDAYRELFNLRFQRAQNQLKDTNSIRRVRKDIAKMKTILRQRELAAQLQAAAAPPAGGAK